MGTYSNSINEIVQIAGIIDQREARMLVESGVDWLGFPLRLPVHQEDISDTRAAKIIAALKPPHAAVLITYLSKAEAIYALCRKLATGIVQIHGSISAVEIQQLRSFDPRLLIVKSLIVKKDNLAELTRRLLQLSPLVDAFITDTHDPLSGADGATGKIHDWSISRRLVARSPKPIILAGGLKPENVRQAILEVRPAGVDAHSGVEAANGRKSRQRVVRFVTEARQAFRELNKG